MIEFYNVKKKNKSANFRIFCRKKRNTRRLLKLEKSLLDIL